MNKKCGRSLGRHYVPPPASNDTGTAFLFSKLRRGRDETHRWCELMTLLFDNRRSPRLSVIRVLLLCQSTKCKFRSIWSWSHGSCIPCDLVPWPLTLEVTALAADAGLYVLQLHTNFEVLRLYRSEDMAHFVWLRKSACDPDLWTLKLVRNTALVPSCQFWWYYDYSFSTGPTWLRLITWPCDLDVDLGGHGACGWCGLTSSIRIPSLNFVGLAIRKIWRTMH